MGELPMMKSIQTELDRTTGLQRDAADPTASVWVSANAGTGKTHVLTMRVLRLMLAGTAPERILCLTYTKAASAEMSKRIFETLAKWVVLSDADLRYALGNDKFLDREPTVDEMAMARTLFTRATETPGGLRVQTIHAFAERLLQRFPLEAGVTPGFTILDEETSRTLRREATDAVLSLASRNKSSDLGRALQAAVVYAADDRFDEVLADALKYREWLEAAERLEARKPGGPAGLDATQELFEAHFGVRPGATRGSICDEIGKLLSDADLTHIRDVLQGGSANDQKLAEKITYALRATTPYDRADELCGVFFKSDGAPRDKLLTNGLKAKNPELEPILDRASSRFIALWNELRGADAVQATMALVRLASAVMQRYTDAKAHRAALDFDDLIDKTRSLLRSGGSAEWVLYKLDNGLDHILVDESQDTSPAQWQVVEALAAEFFSGSGAREEVRTVFAVGDEKQSIYSFQGAAPDMFARMGGHFADIAKSASIPWRTIPLNLSFRTVEPVLRAVDQVFADATRTPGVEASGKAIRHIAKRFGHSGLVEIWPTELPDDIMPPDAWSPLEEQTAEPPVVRLANRIADTIKRLTSGEKLASTGRPISPGDIIILVRKRQPFTAPMVAALKARGIPVAGADRMRLTEQIAVQDMLSLGDFLTLPEDDLALAEVLKSPMFGFDDDDLLKLAHGRKGTLWKALLDNAGLNARFETAATTLKRWRKAADFRPPFEFFADLLDRDGMRAKLIGRLGPEAADPLDEFLSLALTYDDSAPPSLSGFLAFMRDGNREIKRDMEHGRNEVRVMTVHGAKGLEAPIVFLPDTCSAKSAGSNGGKPMKLADLVRPEGMPEPFVWPVKNTSKLEPIRTARAAIEAREREELHRLLYVAMTRARDRLYVAGFEGKKSRDKGCWYDLITEGLARSLTRVEAAPGFEVMRLETPQAVPPEAPKGELTAHHAPVALPSWASARAPREPQLTVPLSPSQLAPYDHDSEGEPVAAPPPKDELQEAAPLAPAAMSDGNRFLRGTLTHALLEHLPAFDAKTWPKVAKAFVAERGKGLTSRAQASVVKEALAILEDPAFAPVFSATSRAEVPIVAVIPRPSGTGPALRIAGQIDRLVELPNEVLIIDYKTNRSTPRTPEDVAPVYLYQLAAYRLAVAEIFPGKTVRAALLWTDGARLMEVSSAHLDTYASRLWLVDPARETGPGMSLQTID
jgi:ATP-dependent helicase/nuclease subunit A